MKNKVLNCKSIAVHDLYSFIEYNDKDMLDCKLLNELFLEIRIEIFKERDDKTNKTLIEI